MSTPATFPISTASFWSYTFNWDGLLASETISQSAKIAGGLGLLKRGTVLYGPASPAPITAATLLTTATGSGQARVILAADIDTTGGPAVGLVYTQGKFLDTALIFTAAGAASDSASLWDFGVYVLTVLQRSGLLVPMMSLPATGGPMPQNLTPKRAAELTNEQVEAIKSAMAAWHPEPVAIPDQLPPNPPVPPGTPAPPARPVQQTAPFPTGHVMAQGTKGESTQSSSKPHDKK